MIELRKFTLCMTVMFSAMDWLSNAYSQIPGSVAPVTLTLTVASELPGTFQRDENGKIIGSGIFRRPVFSNNWNGWEEHVALLGLRRYSNKEFLNDLVQEQVIQDPITGWSLVRVMVSSYDFDNDTNYRYDGDQFDAYTFAPGLNLPSINFYVVKAGETPVRVNNYLSITNSTIVRGTKYLIDWDQENFSFRPVTPKFRNRVNGQINLRLLGAPSQIFLGGNGNASFTGISDHLGPRHRSLVFLGNFINIWVNYPMKISNINGTGPNYSGGQGATPSIVSGSIQIGQGVIRDVSTYPFVLQ
jgi:hypothetical protein